MRRLAQCSTGKAAQLPPAAYLAVLEEIFPMETRAMAVSDFFFAAPARAAMRRRVAGAHSSAGR